MGSWPPAVADFEAYFTREFVYGSTPDTVMPADVSRALTEAGIVFNTGLWTNAGEMQTAYLYAAAHFLALNVQGAGGLSATNAGRGISSGGAGAIESKSVGGVSVSYAIPDIVRQNPLLSQFWITNFGQKFLALLMPRLVGNVMLVSGNPDVSMAPNMGNNIGTTFGGTTITPLSITTTMMPAGVHAVAYSQTIAGMGGLAPYRWTISSGTIPPGLTLDPVTGILAGTPTTIGTYFFIVTVTDGRGATGTMSFQVVIS